MPYYNGPRSLSLMKHEVEIVFDCWAVAMANWMLAGVVSGSGDRKSPVRSDRDTLADKAGLVV